MITRSPLVTPCACSAPGELGHTGLQFGKGDLLLGPGDRAVVDNGKLIRAAVFHMAVHGVVTAVDLRIGVPFVHVGAAVKERFLRWFHPVNGLGGVKPETFRILFPGLVECVVAHVFVLPVCNWLREGRPPEQGPSAPMRQKCKEIFRIRPDAAHEFTPM